ncbi:hypothetical protein TNCV_3165961 [Trichonephila clavipes]|uniref:Uncharacterized protein n=1 Tax=Trichonephila clavipes TaxID=2585209 RepID=A0A8X6RHW3_TRICX|nr:hypothetical protein TNCV_3165961 [Trichonephila clavipes]
MVSGNCLWNNCYAYVLLVLLNESLWGPQVMHNPSIFSPRGLPGLSKPGFPHMGTFSCPLLPKIYNRTLRMIGLASNTAGQPACSFPPDGQASLKLA